VRRERKGRGCPGFAIDTWVGNEEEAWWFAREVSIGSEMRRNSWSFSLIFVFVYKRVTLGSKHYGTEKHASLRKSNTTTNAAKIHPAAAKQGRK
jgi:hypothetical protein